MFLRRATVMKFISIRKFFLIFVLFGLSSSEYDDISNAIPNLPVQDAIVMYYADMNDDRFTDILIYSPSSETIYAILMNSKAAHVKTILKAPTSGSLKLQSLVVSDFTGNSIGDIMVCMGSTSNSNCEIWIAYCKDYMKFGDFKKIDTFSSQPLMFDFDSDLRSDLYGSKQGNSRAIISNHGSEKQFQTKSLNGHSTLSDLNSFSNLAIVDVTGDANADILEITNSNGQPSIHIIPRVSDKFEFTKPVSLPHLPERAEKIGSPCFADFDNDLHTEMVLPVCTSSDCSKSSLYLFSFSSKKWSKLQLSGVVLQLQSKDNHPLNQTIQLAAVSNIICMDANLDSRPDILVANGNNVILYVNKGGNSFIGKSIIHSNKIEMLQAAFFDHGEDGQPDILVNILENKSKRKLQIYRAKVDKSQDINYFVKVAVVAPSDKSKKNMGLVYPGSFISLSMTGLGGNDYRISATFLPQTSYLSLNLPYVIFGLGASPNFIDSISVTIPSKSSLNKEFTSLMPNSQIYVIVNTDESATWQYRAIIRPESKTSLLYVGLTLLGSFVLCSIIVGALQLKEYFHDKKEREIEARKFNFDAM